jgi:hypothetical protein
MPSFIQNVSRRYVALAFGAALVGAAASSAPAEARTQKSAFACDPSYEYCDIQYLYYSSSAKTTQVGYAEDPCDSGYTLVWGYTTSHVTKRVFYCPI